MPSVSTQRQGKRNDATSNRPDLGTVLPRVSASHYSPVQDDTHGLAQCLGFERRTRPITDWQGIASVFVGFVLATLALAVLGLVDSPQDHREPVMREVSK